MDSRSISQLLIIILGVIAAVVVGSMILDNPTGGISGLSMTLSIFAVIVSLISPRKGLFVLAIQAIYTDEIKRIGVYYGVESHQTVREILVGPLLTLTALNTSVFLNAAFRNFKIPRIAWLWYAIVPFFFAYIFFGAEGASLELRSYNGLTASLYFSVVPVMYCAMNGFEDWKRYFSFQTAIAIPAAAWAIWQYYNGFNEIEWAYARSGLSEAHSFGMLAFAEPRVFGLFGSSNALGCVSLYGTFCIWRAVRDRKCRWFFLASGVLFFAVCVYSRQRTILLYPLIVFIFSFVFRTKFRTVLAYATIVALFIAGVFSATWLLYEGIDKINDAIQVSGEWGEDVLNVNTFSDRLRGWERLGRAKSWSLFGTGMQSLTEGPVSFDDEEFSHDMINQLLKQAGVVGLATCLAVVFLLARIMHNIAWSMPDRRRRNDSAFVLASVIPMLIMSAAGGGNFTTTPINLMIWSMLAGIFMIGNESTKQERNTEAIAETSAIPAKPSLKRLRIEA